jgi:aminoglycoside phosphotransferase (APT) family kinase protein
MNLQLLGRGRTAELYAWKPGQVVKLFYTWCSRHSIEEEIENNRLLSALDLPRPALLEVVEVQGRIGLVYTRIEGPVMVDIIRKRPWQVFEMMRLLAELQVRVQRCRAPGLPSLSERLQHVIGRAPHLDAADKTHILQALQMLPGGESVCHFDLHVEQVLLSPEGPVLLDWMNTCQGNPAADAARTFLILRIGRDGQDKGRQTAPLRWFRRLFSAVYLRHYLSLNPQVSRAQVEDWLLPVAAARLAEQIEPEREDVLAWVRRKLA